MFFPETRNGMRFPPFCRAACETAPLQSRGMRRPAKVIRTVRHEARAFPKPCKGEKFRNARRSAARASGRRRLLLAPPLHRGGDAHRFAVFGDSAPRDVDPRRFEFLDDGVV